MPDILSHGGDREPGPRWRRLAVIAVLVAVVVVVVVLHFPRHPHAHAQWRRAAASATTSPSAAGGSRPPPAGVPAAALPNEPSGVIGPTLPWDVGLRLLVTGDRPAWYWPAMGRTEPIGGLPRDRSGYLFVRVGGGWAVQSRSPVQSGPATRPGCGTCASLPSPVYFLGDGARTVTRAGLADQVAPATTAGALWLISFAPDADMSTAVGTAQEVSGAGAVIGPQVRLPAGYVIDQATSRGLLLAPALQQRGTTFYQLWNPASRKASRTFHNVIAAGPNEIAWTPPCASLCRARVLSLATGRVAVVTLPRNSSAASGAFSPDGSLLALQVSFGTGSAGGSLAMQLAVASAATGQLTLVPGTWASSDALVGFGWPAAGDTLVAELSFTTKVQVTSWRPGAGRLAVAAIRPRHGATSLIVG